MKNKHHFEGAVFRNRWKEWHYRLNDETIIGIDVFWRGRNIYAVKLCLLGLELQLWFAIKPKD